MGNAGGVRRGNAKKRAERREIDFASDAIDEEIHVQTAIGNQTQMATSCRVASEFESLVVESEFIEKKLNNTSIAKTTNQEGRKALKDCNAILFQEIILSDVKDGKGPHYMGIDCFANGRVVITDCNSSTCCLYDSSYNHMSDCTMSSKPWGMCIIDADEVAVALPYDNKIQFLKIGDTIQPSGHITTRRKCMSLVALNKKELVYAGTEKNEKTYYWGTITRDGREKSCFHIPRGNIKYSEVYIALNSCKTRVYISCYHAKTVYCFGLDGVQHSEYKVQEGPRQGKPFGIELDSENNVYVVVNDLHSIHRLSPECQLRQVIKDMIPKFPKAICFKQSGDNFLLTAISTTNSNICYSYKLK